MLGIRNLDGRLVLLFIRAGILVCVVVLDGGRVFWNPISGSPLYKSPQFN